MPDVGSIAARLYAGPREEFVKARDEAARRAPAELAAEIRALPKPTTAAWLVNQVAHRHPNDVKRLVELGAALRNAYENRAGDRLRELVRQRHEVLRVLTGDVRSVARDAGYKLAGQVADQVQETFEAALLDAEIGGCVRAGRLATAAKVPNTVGLPALPARPAAPKPRKPAPKPKPKPRTEPKEDREAAEQARKRLTEARAEQQRADQELARATKIAERAGARVAQLSAELDRAREAEDAANQDVTDATEQARRAKQAVERALDGR